MQLRNELDPLQVIDSLLPICSLVICQGLLDATNLAIQVPIILDGLENVLDTSNFGAYQRAG